MLKQLIDLGLTALNVAQLANNNCRDEKEPEQRKKAARVNHQISNTRNVAYILRRLIK